MNCLSTGYGGLQANALEKWLELVAVWTKASLCPLAERQARRAMQNGWRTKYDNNNRARNYYNLYNKFLVDSKGAVAEAPGPQEDT